MSGIFLLLGFVLTSTSAHGEVGAWSFEIGCPESGTSCPPGTGFSASTLSGFSSTGTCSRTPTRFTKFQFATYSGGVVNSATFYGHHTADVLIVPPILNDETKPVFLADAKCPASNKTLNWLFATWPSELRSNLTNFPTVGRATYDTSSGITLTDVADVQGTTFFSGNVPFPGEPCSGGVVALTGVGDRSGSLFLTRNGSGYHKADSGKATLFVPVYHIDPANDLGSVTFTGIFFNSTSASDTKHARVTGDPTGTILTVSYYADPDSGTFDSSFTDTLNLTTNSPSDGLMTGTISRSTGGVGSVVCVMARGVASRIQCTGNTPDDITVPFGLVFSAEGPQILGLPSPKSSAVEIALKNPYHSFTDGTRFYVSDYENNRVLIWNSIPTSFQQPADVVLGQPNMTSNLPNNGGVSAQTLYNPTSVYSDGSRLFVSDYNNSRVLIWNSIPTVFQKAADLVLGQPNMTSRKRNVDGILSSPSAQSLANPTGVYFNGTKLFVADWGNSRVLIWNSLPTSNQEAASLVLGQPSMTSLTANNGGRSAQSLNAPSAVYSDGTKLFVSDGANHRILIWNSIPTTNRAAANLQLGQPGMTQGTANNGGISAQSLNTPFSVYTANSKLYVSDTLNNRVLVWDSIPTSNRQAANAVLGQPSMGVNTSNQGGISGQTLSSPRATGSDGTSLFVADEANDRVLIWNAIPTLNQQSASFALGRVSVNSSGAVEVSAQRLYSPKAIVSSEGKLIVADEGNNRVLIWNSIPSANYTPADIVLGQPSMTSSTSNNGGVSATSLDTPSAIYSDGTKLYVSDGGNHRILIWNTIPTFNQQPADLVLGQSDMSTNGNSITASSIGLASSIHSDGTRLFVADGQNNRVLIWSSIPTSNQQAANLVLGQPNMTSNTSNNGGLSNRTMSSPRSVYSTGTSLFVADGNNNRVLIWNSIPTTNQQVADLVLGQPNMASSTANNGGTTAQSLNRPSSIYSDGSRLYAADEANSRVLVWNSIPTGNRQAADAVLGQPDMTSNVANNGGISSQSLNSPASVYSDGSKLYIVDTGNHRVLTVDIP